MTRTLKLIEAARLVGAKTIGPDDLELTGVAPVEDASAHELGFLASRRYLARAAESRAGALLIADSLEPSVDADRPRIVVPDPHRALRILLEHFHPEREHRPEIHRTAVIGQRARIGLDCRIGPYVVIGDDSVIGDGVRIDAHACVGERCAVGDGSHLFPHVVLYDDTVLGRNVTLHAGAKVGVDGFGYVYEDGAHRKVPQVGACVIEDDVDVGANTTIDRGSIGATRVGEGSKLDNLVQLGHNVDVGPGCLLAGQAGVAGSTRLGPGVFLGGQAGLSGHLEVGAGARVGAQAGVVGDIEPGATVIGFPARGRIEFLRNQATLAKLPLLLRRLKLLDRERDA
jgi:UDP-3-O-[3-hydroxymyristoyl] glucosamine N-acyltransferase